MPKASRPSTSYPDPPNDGSHGKVPLMVDLMGLEEGVDRDFARARRRARAAAGGVRRGRGTVEAARVVGSVGKGDLFDGGFMPLGGLPPERWKRVDRAFRLGIGLPPVSLYEVGGSYFALDGNHQVSVARFHGVEWIDADVTEFRAPHLAAPATPGRPVRGPSRPGGKVANNIPDTP